MSYNLNIDLLKFKRAALYNGFKDKAGNPVPCVVIPIKENYIAVKESNGYSHAFASVNMWERTNRETNEPEHDQYGNSHALQLQIPKDIREQMDVEERRAASVYLGSAKPMGSINAPLQQSQPSFRPQQQRQDYSQILPETPKAAAENDLPF